jgi:hypothetical protein
VKISDVLDKIRTEKQTPGRFPTRIIFVRNWEDYVSLAGEIGKLCDVTLNLASYAKGDIIPKFKDLHAELGKYTNKTVLLLSFGEYLRLCSNYEKDKSGGEFKDLWEQMQAESAITKYIVLLFGGRELFDNAVSYVSERQIAFLWEVAESVKDTDIKITVYSPDFADAVSVDADCLSAWLSKWDSLFAEKRSSFSLRTKLYKYAAGSFGNVRIDVVNKPFTYVASLLADGDDLKKEYGDDQFWSEVAKSVQPDKPFSATIDYALNVGHSFDPISILAKFEQLSETERLLFWIRYKMYSGNDYVSYAVSKTSNPDEIPLAVRDAVFSLTKPSDAQLAERLKAISVLNLRFEDSYFTKLDKVSAESRFTYLTSKTAEERTYAVKTVSELLRKGGELTAIAKKLSQSYHALAEYLTPTQIKEDGTTSYFEWYRKSKLINRVPETVAPLIDLDCIDSRNKIIQNNESGYPLWIDGLGAEWLPLLFAEIKRLSIATEVICKTARSILPSETEFNHQWNCKDEKWDRLDKLNHNGMPDDKNYYSCVAQQIEYIREIAQRVGELLVDHNCIVITGDHGSSRLAALMFHSSENYYIAPFKNSIVRSFGRFCELPFDSDVQITDSMEAVTAKRDGQDVKCVVIKTYEHFKQSGNAAGDNTDDNAVIGEVHGGATPEECLVPVIIVNRKNPLLIEPSATTIKKQAAAQNKMGI